MGFAKDMPTAKTQHPERRENERLLVDLRFISNSDSDENVVVDLCANMIKYCVLEEEDDDSDNFPLNNCRESVFILSEESDR